MSAKYTYLEEGDRVPDEHVMLVIRLVRMSNETTAIQCQTSNELNAWNTIVSLTDTGEIIVSKDLPHGLFQSDFEDT